MRRYLLAALVPRHSFENFPRRQGERPPGWSIDRINKTATTNKGIAAGQRKGWIKLNSKIKAVATKRIIFLVQNLKRVGRDLAPPVPEALRDGSMLNSALGD
jgi:hypothetical protein